MHRQGVPCKTELANQVRKNEAAVTMDVWNIGDSYIPT